VVYYENPYLKLRERIHTEEKLFLCDKIFYKNTHVKPTQVRNRSHMHAPSVKELIECHFEYHQRTHTGEKLCGHSKCDKPYGAIQIEET